MKEIIVVSEGSEIAYAKVFADLLKTQIDDDIIMSIKGRSVKTELYSKQVYLKSGVPPRVVNMLIGNVTVKTPDMELAYNKNGMRCYVGNQFVKLIVDPEISLANYDSIFSDLERIEKEYFEIESEYVERSGRKKTAYVEKTTSLFSRKWAAERIMQAYLFLAYYFFIYEL